MAKVQNRYTSAPPFGCLFSLQTDDLHKIVGHRFGLRLHIPGGPPFDGFREAARQMLDQKFLRDLLCKQGRVPAKEAGEILLEIGHELTVPIGSEDAPDVHLIFLQMIEDVTQLQLQIFAVQGSFLLGQQIREYMVENVAAQALQQIVLGFKMGIEGAAADIGLVDDLLHGNGAVLLLLHQRPQRLENGRSCFLLTSVQHGSS